MTGKANAVVQLYYPNDGSFIEALVSVYSVKKYNQDLETVLLCHRTTSESHQNIFEQIYDRVILIDSLDIKHPVNEGILHFSGVLDKFLVFALEEYEKVILLDLDTLVLSDLTELLSCPAPAAFFNESKLLWSHGTKMDGDLIDFRRNHPKFGSGYMNCGVVVLQPSLVAFNKLINFVEDRADTGVSCSCLEQELLRDFYLEDWYQISKNYNFMSGTLINYSFNGKGRDFLKVARNELRIIHYASCFKPVQLLFNPEDFKIWAQHFPKNANSLLFDSLEKGSFPRLDHPAQDCWERFSAFIGEWFRHFAEMQESVPFSVNLDNLNVRPYLIGDEVSRHLKRAEESIEQKRVREKKKGQPRRKRLF